ncbi:hypothetical protein K440DRAFT_641775 [Wilcoxina mikolae CBS 423.85]|nr:hypothetical protein K440DRAFT_641775 [Wilcoxina mikolae CBS 423.85]
MDPAFQMRDREIKEPKNSRIRLRRTSKRLLSSMESMSKRNWRTDLAICDVKVGETWRKFYTVSNLPSTEEWRTFASTIVPNRPGRPPGDLPAATQVKCGSTQRRTGGGFAVLRGSQTGDTHSGKKGKNRAKMSKHGEKAWQ